MVFDAVPYSLALLKLVEDDSTAHSPLGTATRLGSSTFEVPAHHFLQALLAHALSPETMAKGFIDALGKSGNPVIDALASEVSNESCVKAPEAWAREVYEKIKEFGDLPEVTRFATNYLSHLIVAFRNPGGKKTPQTSVLSSPGPRRIDEIDELLQQATHKRSQIALRELIFQRDGYECPITSLPFRSPSTWPPSGRSVIPRCAHIIPFSVGKKTQTMAAIEMFTGHTLDAKTVLDNINHPRNALNLENNAHDSMDRYLAWGIEALPADHGWKYYFRIVRDDCLPPPPMVELEDSDEIHFGRGASNERIALPDPNFCNIHLAICRVSHACGASEIFDQFVDDEDGGGLQVPAYFGSPFVSDDILMRQLEVLAS